MLKKFLLTFFLCMVLSNVANALSFSKKTPHVKLNIIPEYTAVSPQTKKLTLLAAIDIKPDWHLYWDNPGDAGDPTTLIYYDSPHFTITKDTHSFPSKSVLNDIITAYVYRDKTYFKTEFALNNLDNIKKLNFNAVLTYTVCQKECLPEKINLQFSLPINHQKKTNPSFLEELLIADNSFPISLETEAVLNENLMELKIDEHILKACDKPEFISHRPKKSILANLPRTTQTADNRLLINFDDNELTEDIAGILLCNTHAYTITPKIKNITLSSSSSDPTSEHNFIYYLLTAFIAGLILNLMPCVLPILSLKALYLAAHKEKASLLSAIVYLLGVLTSFMVLSGLIFYLKSIGTELGWGFQLQSAAFNIFLLILFFAIFLNLIDKLSIPDKWSDKLSKIAGNKSFLTGFFAVIIACPCTGPFMGGALGYAIRQPELIYFTIFLSLGFGYALPYVLIEAFPQFFLKFIPKPGAWMITLKRILSLPIALTCLWLGWVTYNQLCPTPKAEILWETYSPKSVEQALQKQESVFIDFTAKWCLVCLLNDKTTLNSPEFKQLSKEKNIHLFKADWTNHNKEITDALKSYQRNSIPLYIYYKKGSSVPIYLPQILTVDTLKKNMK